MHVHDSGQMDNEAESEEDAFDQNASPLGGGGGGALSLGLCDLMGIAWGLLAVTRPRWRGYGWGCCR